jgi:transmembrane sensor
LAVKPEPNQPSLDPAVESAAAEWLVRHDRGLTPRQQDDFLQWLAASPAHRESFDRHRRMWGDFNALAQWRPEHSSVPNPDLLARPRRARVWRWWAPVALAAAAGIALAMWWSPVQRLPSTETLSLTAASYRQETLPDGSVLDLNRGAHVVVQFSPSERRVLLAEGEAQFTVAKNPARPFIVRAGGVDVRAVGTAFNVKLAGPQLEVLVTEGTVRVSQSAPHLGSGAKAKAPAGAPPEVLALVSAGERTVVGLAEVIARPVVVPVSKAEVGQLLDWQPRLLDFNSEPLANVVAVFNRRGSARLVIGDEALRTLPIIASIRSDNVDGFVRLLEATMGVRAERQPDGEIVLRRGQ